MRREISSIEIPAIASGVSARAKRRSDDKAVTSSLVLSEMMQEIKTLNGLPLHWATIVTAGVLQFLYSSRNVTKTVWISSGFIGQILSHAGLLCNSGFTFLSWRASMPAMSIDLHIHSSYSDGAFTPAELVERAEALGVSLIAIADHDSVAGVAEAAVAGIAAGVDVLPAVELSVQFGEWQDIHLLGYGINHEDELFLKKLDIFRQRRDGRNDSILDRVNEMLRCEGRRSLVRERVRAFARDSIGRPHIARALLECGYVDSVENAFRRYLGPCNVPKSYWPIDEAINEIHRIGGIAVLAHPTSISKDPEILGPVIAALHTYGLDGIEVYNNMGWPLEIEFLRRTALEKGMLATAGSDFHGIEEGLEIGRGREGIRFDSALLAPLYERLQKIRK